MALKVLIADEQHLFRKGLTSLINQIEDLKVISEASNGQEVVKLAKTLCPDIIIMDINLPELNGIEAAQQIKSFSPDTKIIALSMYSDKKFIKEMFRSGGNAYVIKDCALDELMDAIHVVTSGRAYLSKCISASFMADMTSSVDSPIAPIDLISLREREVLRQIANGHSTKEIASFLNLSTKTVESHRKNIMDKLEIHSVAELTKFAIREGLTSLDSDQL